MHTHPSICEKNGFLYLVFFLSFTGFSQTLTRGIIVDSVSLEALAGVHVKLKSSARGTVTDANGAFALLTRPTDTLFISRVGYIPIELPLLFEESGILIRMSENVRMLKEITITAIRLNSNESVRSPRRLPTPMPASFAFSSPFDYFSKWQREKRKLLALIRENDRTSTYVQVVTDPEVRENIMYEHSLTEQEYFDLLVKYNQESADVIYSTRPQEIIDSMRDFFTKAKR